MMANPCNSSTPFNMIHRRKPATSEVSYVFCLFLNLRPRAHARSATNTRSLARICAGGHICIHSLSLSLSLSLSHTHTHTQVHGCRCVNNAKVETGTSATFHRGAHQGSFGENSRGEKVVGSCLVLGHNHVRSLYAKDLVRLTDAKDWVGVTGGPSGRKIVAPPLLGGGEKWPSANEEIVAYFNSLILWPVSTKLSSGCATRAHANTFGEAK